MSEPVDRNWTMTFPIEATAFVVALILVVLLSAGWFLLGGIRTNSFEPGVRFGGVGMDGGGFVDQPIEDSGSEPVPAPEGPPVITTVAP